MHLAVPAPDCCSDWCDILIGLRLDIHASVSLCGQVSLTRHTSGARFRKR